MNPIAEEILMHYGMPRRSGRYPWGSGENPYQHSGDFLSRIDELKSQGMSDTEIAKAMGLTTTQYRTQKSLAKDERRALDVARAKSLREDGLSLNEIAKEMGFANDSFEQFTSWFMFDEEKGYHTCSYLGRIARTSDQLSEEENELENERAIDEILKYDFRNIYKKVVQKT